VKILKLIALTLFFCAAHVGSVHAGVGQPTARVVTNADDRTFTHKDGGIQFDLPEGWNAQPDGDTLIVSAPDDSLKMIFLVEKQQTFDATIKELGDVLDKLMTNVKVDSKGKEDELNGIKTFSLTGIGDVKGSTIKWSVDILAAKRPVIIISFAAPGVWEKHIEAYGNLIKSIRKV
jgi:predicted Zn-dependent protease